MLRELSITGPKSHSSSVDASTADKVREKIRDRKRKEPPPVLPELELPLRKRSRVLPRRPGFRRKRDASASVRPSIPVTGAGKRFRPPIGTFRPPVMAKKPPAGAAAQAAPVGPSTVPVKPPQPVIPPAVVPPVARHKPAQATRVSDLASAGQEMGESAMEYGRAFMDWSFAANRGAAPTAPF